MNERETLPEQSSEMRLMKYAMWTCCAVMLIPVAAFAVAGRHSSDLSFGLSAFAPVLVCVGAHVIAHRMMGIACHGAAGEKGRQTGNGRIQTDQSVAVE